MARARTIQARSATPGDEAFIPIAEGAAIINTHPATLRRYISDGLLPGYRIGKRALRVRKSDLLAFVQTIGAA